MGYKHLPTSTIVDILELVSIKEHVYVPQYPELTSVKESNDTLNAVKNESSRLERLANGAVVVQSAVTSLGVKSTHAMLRFPPTTKGGSPVVTIDMLPVAQDDD